MVVHRKTRETDMNLATILKEFRWGVILALTLVGVENIAWIVEPSVFGPVIDALIEVAHGTPFANIIPVLLIWVTVFAVNSGVGAFRRSFDQKIFLNIFARLARRVAELSSQLNLPISQTAARAELSREFVTFLEYRTPEILEQVIAIVGALVGLAWFDVRLTFACLVVLGPLLAITILYSRKVVPLQADLHDAVEETYDVFSTQNPAEIEAYYRRRSVPQQRIANWGALSFGLMRFSLLGIFLAVLYIAIDLDDFSTGNIYSIVAYIWTFVTSSEYLPELMESWASLKDLNDRMRSDAHGPAAPDSLDGIPSST
jgi:ABC-type multidrug transport system fused ATPase/permease subunit